MAEPVKPVDGSPPSVHLRPARREEARLIRRRVMREGLDPTKLDWRKFVMAESSHEARAGGAILGFAQMKQLGGGVREFGSLVVEPDRRRQGIGGLLIRHFQTTHPLPIYLVCESRRVAYYSTFGFRVLPTAKEMPASLRFKWRAGRLLGRLMKFRIEAMIYDGQMLGTGIKRASN